MADPAHRFLAESRDFLLHDYMPKIERCVAQLSDEQIWARSNDASNSIGNLLLHLAGSSKYWAAEVIDGEPTGRARPREFDRRDPIPAETLLADLRAALQEVDRRLAALSPDRLLEIRSVQGERPTVLWCVYHIVEHFSMHTGQILSMTKALVGELREDAGRGAP
jgi:uncharacterized damage-inducible protein DinB